MQEGKRDGDDEKCKFAGKVPKRGWRTLRKNSEASDAESGVELRAQSR